MFQTILSSKLFAKLSAGVALIGLLAAGIGFSGVLPVAAAPVTYYVDCALGNDANNGTSTATPWKTFANVNSRVLVAGDSVLLKRGATCFGIGSLLPQGNGTPSAPITLGAYGTGNRPIINCGTAAGVYGCVRILNNEGYVIQDLEVTGTKVDSVNGPAGIYLESTVSKKSYFRITNVVSHDVWYGFSIGAYKYGKGGNLLNQSIGNNPGYLDDIIIDGVEAYNDGGATGNGGKGIEIAGNYSGGGFDPAKPLNTNITVRNSNLHDNPGDGIVFTATNGGLVEYITANHNGFQADDRYGIWPWNAKNVVTQFSEAAFNETGTNKGGGGFDCDYNVIGCVFQYGYAHDNEGPGILFIGYGKTNTTDAANVRYNLFVDNCWHATAPDCGDATVFGTVDNSYFHNNTIYFKNRNNNPNKIAAMFLATWGKFGNPTNFHYKNNIVYLTNNSRAYWQEVGGSYFLDYNLLYAESGNLNINWGGTIYNTLAAFQATGQEAHSRTGNPLFAAPGGTNAADYQVSTSSLAVNGGVDLGASLMGTRDYFGNTAPQGGAYDIGFHETGGGGGPTATPTRTNTPVPPTDTPGGPTNTPTPTPTRTNTPVPPTATNTPVPGSGPAFVKNVGTAACGNTSNVITVPAGGVAAGNTLVVRVTLRAGSPGTGTVSVADSKGNTYTVDKDITNANIRLVILSANVATALVSGDTITASHPPVNPSATGLVATEFSGIVATNRVDVSASATGSSLTPSVSVTTTNAKDLVYGAIVVLNQPTVTEASGWTLDTNLSTGCGGSGGNSINHGAYKITSAAGGQTYNPTLSGANAWVDEIVAYKGQ